MPTRDEVLIEKTHKGGTDTISQRVFYTLTDVKGMELHRTSLLVSHLVEHLVETGQLTEDQLDSMLFKLLG